MPGVKASSTRQGEQYIRYDLPVQYLPANTKEIITAACVTDDEIQKQAKKRPK
jgi:hypothetical protein